MLKRKEKADEAINRWIDDDPELSKAEQEPSLRLILTPDVWGQKGGYLNATNEEIRSIFKTKKGDNIFIPMDAVHSTSNGFIARQVTSKNPNHRGLSFQINRHLECEINFPLQIFKKYEYDTYD